MYVFGAILIGFVGAVLSGMFGVGGAALTTPALRVFLDSPPGIALGTTLPVVIPTAVTGAVTYFRRGLMELGVVLYCGISGAIASAGGALLTRVLNLHYLMILTGAIVLYLGAATFYRGVRGIKRGVVTGESDGEIPEVVPEDDGERTREERRGIPLLLAIGLVGGFVSGLLGLGGGIVMIPAFLYILRMPIKTAFGTSLAIIAIIAVPGTVMHALLGHIDWILFLYLIIGVIPGAYLGARLAAAAKEPYLYMGFGVFVSILGVVFIVNEIIKMI